MSSHFHPLLVNPSHLQQILAIFIISSNLKPLTAISNYLQQCTSIQDKYSHIQPFWLFQAISIKSSPFQLFLVMSSHFCYFIAFQQFPAIFSHSSYFKQYLAISALCSHLQANPVITSNSMQFPVIQPIFCHFQLFLAIQTTRDELLEYY